MRGASGGGREFGGGGDEHVGRPKVKKSTVKENSERVCAGGVSEDNRTERTCTPTL